MSDAIRFVPVTPAQWEDFAALLGPSPDCDGCWCMWWRLRRAEFDHLHRDGRCAAMHTLVEGGEVPGLLAYAGEIPVGWVSVGPREAFGALNRSPQLKPVDAAPAWSVVCFLVAPAWRGKGLSGQLLRAAVDYARAHGATLVEGYPVREVRGAGDSSAFTGALSTFLAAGFQVAADRGGRRVVVRKAV